MFIYYYVINFIIIISIVSLVNVSILIITKLQNCLKILNIFIYLDMKAKI